jgi:hypothetical protein
MRTIVAAALLGLTVLAMAQERTAAPSGVELYIISPKDGEAVKTPFVVRFGLKGMGVAPAGVRFEATGHHHLLVDTAAPSNLDLPLPVTDKVLHFGKGQTETILDLPAGTHTLQLLLGDHNHIPHATPVLSPQITITVAK